MNRFAREKKKHSLLRQIVSTALIFFCAAFFLLYGADAISESANAEQAKSLQTAITRSAVQCYATEGAWPESLTYLREHYGISWDADKYVVDYEILGANLMPTITVIPLS